MTLAQILPTFKIENDKNIISLSWNANFYGTGRNNYSYSKIVPTGTLLEYKFILNNVTYYTSSLGFKYGQFNIKSPNSQQFSINQNGATGSNKAIFPEPFNKYQSNYQWLSPTTTQISISNLPYYLTNSK